MNSNNFAFMVRSILRTNETSGYIVIGPSIPADMYLVGTGRHPFQPFELSCAADNAKRIAEHAYKEGFHAALGYKSARRR